MSQTFQTFADARPELVERLERAVETASMEMRRDFVNMVRPHELSFAQCAVLMVLKEFGGPTKISELGEATLTPPSSMTHTIDRLERRGLIKRSHDANDRRAIRASLTNAGLQLVDEIGEAHREYFMRRCAGLDDDELRMLIRLFEGLGPDRPIDRNPAD